MKHLDLFSGIGGAAIAVDAVWPGSEHTFVEIAWIAPNWNRAINSIDKVQ